MKEYEQKIHNIINNAEEDVIFQAHQAYEQGYATGYDHGKRDGYADGKADTPFTDTEEAEKKAYNRGLNDAWECVAEIFCMKSDDKKELFDYPNTYDIIQQYTVSEAIDIIKAYEDKQKPKCANCRFFHKLKHNFEVGKGFVESHCCTIMLEHDFEPSVKDITWVQEVEENSKCEMFTEKGADE